MKSTIFINYEHREFDLVRARMEQKDLEELIEHAMDVGEKDC